MSTLISVRTEENTIQQLDQIAESLDRNRNWVVNEAIRHYLDLYEWQLSEIQKGIADSDAGRTVTTDELRARVGKLHAARTKKKAG